MESPIPPPTPIVSPVANSSEPVVTHEPVAETPMITAAESVDDKKHEIMEAAQSTHEPPVDATVNKVEAQVLAEPPALEPRVQESTTPEPSPVQVDPVPTAVLAPLDIAPLDQAPVSIQSSSIEEESISTPIAPTPVTTETFITHEPQPKAAFTTPKFVEVAPLNIRKVSTPPRRPSTEPSHEPIPTTLPALESLVKFEVAAPGWDDATISQCTVLHYATKEEVKRRIAWTAKMVLPRMYADHNWSVDKIFGDDDFIAAGQLVISPGCRKPRKAAKDNTYVFYVIEGAINLKIHETSMVLCTGGMFLVPRGNNYLIENICNRDAKLFFTQARKVSVSPEEEAAKRAEVGKIYRRRSILRSQSFLSPPATAGFSVAGSSAGSSIGSMSSLGPRPMSMIETSPVVNPEEGWDDATIPQCTVLYYTTKEEVQRRIAWTAKMVSPRMPSPDYNWSFEKIFGDDDFIAAGQLVIPPGCHKPRKATKHNTYVFYVIEGAINLKIHETSMVLCTGGMFLVPRGNNYLIENICNRDAKLFFTQARRVSMSLEEEAAKRAEVAEIHRRRSILRSSRAGVPTRSTSANANRRTVSFGNLSARMGE